MLFNRKSGTHRKVEQLIRDGVGVRESSWNLPAGSDRVALDALAEPMSRWVRDSMSEMRRPYGIDHVALALACRDQDGRILVSNSFGVVRPGLFYGAEGEGRIAAFLDDVGASGDGPREVVGALLSLGDIAFSMNAKAA